MRYVYLPEEISEEKLRLSLEPVGASTHKPHAGNETPKAVPK